MYWIDRGSGTAIPMGWATKVNTFLMITVVLLLRTLYLVWICPYELVGDEAQYWEWSRRLALSYYSKGPGVAWLIWAGTKLLGPSEWAIRMPSAVASGLTAWFLSRLATACSRGNERVGFMAAAVFCLLPIFHGSAQFMTIDAPYVACWVLACLLAWQLFTKMHRQDRAFGLWAALGMALGVGFLFKYTIVLLIPGIIMYAVWSRRILVWDRSELSGILLGVVVFAVVISPVIVWNCQHGWPTWSHLLGRVRLPGGDMEPHHGWDYNPLWTLEYLLSPLFFLGPLAAYLTGAALAERLREERFQPMTAESGLHFVICCAVPIIAFYLLVSFGTSIELNWSMAGYTTLLIPLAQKAAAVFGGPPAAANSVGGTEAAMSKPSVLGLAFRNDNFKILWKWFVVTHLIIIAAMSFAYPSVIAKIPELGAKLAIHRVHGHRDFAVKIQAVAARVRARTGQAPFIIADSYWRASLLAYYLPGNPVVYSAASRIGSRKSSYDYFTDTNLDDTRLFGRSAVLIGAAPDIWSKAFHFGQLETLDSTDFPPIFWGSDYRGPVESGAEH